jgi:DNA-binding response OmpR family regulator
MPNRTRIALVIEDERPLASAIKTKLGRAGFGVAVARSVAQAKNHITDLGSVDAIWLDHYLIGKELGIGFLAWCKSSKKYKDIPVFFISNTVSPDKVIDYKQLGIQEYFVKANHRLEEIVAIIKE